MKIKRIVIKNILGYSNGDIEFDDKRTTIYGESGIGKTTIVKALPLILFGTQKPKEIDQSFAIKAEELRIRSNSSIRDSSIQLEFVHDRKRYKIYKEWDDELNLTKNMIEELGKSNSFDGVEYTWHACKDKMEAVLENAYMTPANINAILTNEQSLIGSITYEEDLQENIEKSWRRQIRIFRENIDKTYELLGKKISELEIGIKTNKAQKDDIIRGWKNSGIFEKEEKIDDSIIQNRFEYYKKEIAKNRSNVEHYKDMYIKLSQYDDRDLESVDAVQHIIDVCKEKENLDDMEEMEDIQNLKTKSEYYKNLLIDMKKYGDSGIQENISQKNKELSKLKLSKMLDGKQPQEIIQCRLYSIDSIDSIGIDYIVQIPDHVADRWELRDFERAHVAIEYKKERVNSIESDIERLNSLKSDFEKSQEFVATGKQRLLKKIYENQQKFQTQITQFEGLNIGLDTKRTEYFRLENDIQKNTEEIEWLNEEQSEYIELSKALGNDDKLVEKIRDDTIKFINKKCDEFEWNFRAKSIKTKDGDYHIIPIDRDTSKHLSWLSGGEGTIMGLAWRWQIARHFGLPLFLDEIDAKLSPKLKQGVKKWLENPSEEWSNTQIILLTPNPEFIMGKTYEILKDDKEFAFSKVYTKSGNRDDDNFNLDDSGLK